MENKQENTHRKVVDQQQSAHYEVVDVASSSGEEDDAAGRESIGPNVDAAMRMLETGKPSCTEVTSKCGSHEETREMLNEQDTTCGWCALRPKFLKPCSNIKGYLLVLSMNGLLHYLIPFGLIFAVLTTLEKRFHLSSTQSGSIASTYQFSAMFFTVFVGYAGEKGNKPTLMGVGSLVLAAGSVVFALPHFLADAYRVAPLNQSDADLVCPLTNISLQNATDSQKMGCSSDDQAGADEGEGASNFLWVFILAQVMLGFAGAPIFTLGVTYLDENLRPRDFGLYLGIYTAFLNVGPALGFFIGALTLSMSTDVLVDVDSLSITSDNPLWVGAWWLGFVVAAILVAVLAIAIMGFPRMQPGSEKLAKLHQSESQRGSEHEACHGFRENLFDFPRALWKIITNLPFMGICFAMATEWFVIAGMAVFAPKFFEAQLNLSSSNVATIIGVLSVTAQLTGALGSGVAINRLDLKFKGLMKLCLLCVSVSILSSLTFTMYCPVVPFAGVSHIPTDKVLTSDVESPFSLPCSAHCSCSSKPFDPVCGSDGVMYYSPCHAGCAAENLQGDSLVYHGCQCVLDHNLSASLVIDGAGQSTNLSSYGQPPEERVREGTSTPDLDGRAVPGRCPTTCSYKWAYFILLWVFFFINTFAVVPAWTASIRCVSHTQRAFALGVQTVIYGLGSAPSSIVFGLFIDKSCLVWETLCDGSQICWLYDNRLFAHALLGLVLVCKLLSLVFFGGAHLLYRPTRDGGAVEADCKVEDL